MLEKEEREVCLRDERGYTDIRLALKDYDDIPPLAGLVQLEGWN